MEYLKRFHDGLQPNIADCCAPAASCTAIEVTGAGDLSGTYYQDETLARPTFYRSGGVDLYSVYPDTLTGLWKMRPTVKETVPVYEVSRAVSFLVGQLANAKSLVHTAYREEVRFVRRYSVPSSHSTDVHRSGQNSSQGLADLLCRGSSSFEQPVLGIKPRK